MTDEERGSNLADGAVDGVVRWRIKCVTRDEIAENNTIVRSRGKQDSKDALDFINCFKVLGLSSQRSICKHDVEYNSVV